MKSEPVFDPEAFLAWAAKTGGTAKYKNQEMIFAQGEPANAVFYIKTGRVKVTVLSQQGKSAVVALLGPGDFFGEGCMTGQSKRLTSAGAISECTVARLEKSVLARMLLEEPKFAEMFIAYLLARELRMEADLVDHLLNTSEKRLARLLLILAPHDDDKGTIPNISQETLAEMVGTTRSRINFFMNKFRRLGLIEYNKHLTVNRALMNVIIGE